MKPHQIPSMPLKPLERISPSRYLSMRNCVLREVWAANSQVPALLPTHPSARVGSVIHKLLELAGQGLINDEQTMQEYWRQQIFQVENQMSDNWLERHMVPLSKNTRNFQVKQQLYFLMIRNLLGHRSQQVSSHSSKYEVWVETKDKKVAGRVDAIRCIPEGVQIIDYKSGSVTEQDSGSDIVKQDYQQQLKLYAAIYQEAHGTWPVKLTVVGLDQYEYDIKFDIEECRELLNTAKIELDLVNSQVLQGIPQDGMAKPSPEACKYCIYRPGCNRYWQVRQVRQDTDAWPIDIYGVVKDKKLLGNGLYSLRLNSRHGEINIRGLDLNRNRYLQDETLMGIRFYNLSKDKVPGYFYANMYTIGYLD
ncbi:MAG: PD-(D/E)XK nuclease family protein [Bacillota bacterium]